MLYGIGRYTATLLDGLEDFHIVGLMDKDPNNIGKRMFGLPIMSKEEVEEIADLVIINTSETYWNVIYHRIKDMKTPIYYINGEKAQEIKEKRQENPYNNLSFEKLYAEIEKADLISFDFFDTLFMRGVCSPQDIFRVMELQLGIPFVQMRDKAKKKIRENYSLDELYEQMEKQENISHEQIKLIRDKEIALEKKLLLPRKKMLEYLNSALRQNKEVYIISDIYLPKVFYMDAFSKYRVNITEDSILLSHEINANKHDGTMWKYYAEKIVKGRCALHIGDNKEADIERPGEYGIRTYYSPGVWDMLWNSPMKKIMPEICSIYDTTVIGSILDKIFEDPYALGNKEGKIYITNNHDMGYCVFGPVMLTFLMWLLEKSREDGIKKLVFMARDGYFIKEDLEYLCKITGEKIASCYIGISRQLAMMASIESMQDLIEYTSMPYTGSIEEMFQDRFGIDGVEEQENKQIEDYIHEYLPKIKKIVSKIRRDYINYIEKFGIDNDCAVVDIGYYGNNQKYLNKLLKTTKIKGYYFNANLSEKNKNTEIQKMTACFQKDNDATAENSNILKKQIYLESFLTAPYGMIKAVDERGKFLWASNGKNQEYFKDKEEINEGVKHFMSDYTERFGKTDIQVNIEIIDTYYGECFGGALEFTEEIKKSFYNDNAMMNRIESNLFC